VDEVQPPPPPDSGQHTPEPPVCSHENPAGQLLPPSAPPPALHPSTQYMFVPSLPHCCDAQSLFFVHGEPRPPGVCGPPTQWPLSQMSLGSIQSELCLHAAP